MRDDELYHYGVPGMKWGHHKTRRIVVKSKPKTKKRKSSKEDNLNLLGVGQAVGYTISSVGAIAGLVTGNAILVAGSNFVGNAIAATGSIGHISKVTVDKGREFAQSVINRKKR